MAEIAVFGTAAADIIVRVPYVPRAGDHISAAALGWRLGGGSANVACWLAADGHDVELIGPFGDDAIADALRRELDARGVGTRWAYELRGRSPRALILLDDAGERSILGLDAGSVTDSFPLRDIPDVGTPAAIFVEGYDRYPASIANRHPDAVIFATPPDGRHEEWPADVLVGSERLFQAQDAAAAYASARRVAGARLRWVVVTRGTGGADAFGPDRSTFVAARPAHQVDATGAGDAFTAGLMCALLAGSEIEQAMTAAVERGAAAVEVLRSVPPAWLDGSG